MSEQPIGIFDSGVGGLTVYKELRRLLPSENFIYLGDTARVPYGTKSEATVKRYALQDGDFLREQGVKALVIACNTASAFALADLQEKMSVPVIGVIEPGVLAALKATRNRHIGIIGTEATINSRVYEKYLLSKLHNVKLTAQATPLFVPLVEENITQREILFPIIDFYLQSFKRDEIDTVILACTHYPLLKVYLHEYFQGRVALVDSAEQTAINVRDVLGEKKLLNSAAEGKTTVYVTDTSLRVKNLIQLIMGDADFPINKVVIE